jgi:hypothetical protein
MAQGFPSQVNPVARQPAPLQEPRQQYLLQGRGREHGKDASERVMGGNPMGQLQKRAKERLVHCGPFRDLHKIITARQHPTEA